MLLMHGFVLYIYASKVVTKNDVINSNVNRNERYLVAFDVRLFSRTGFFFQNLRILYAFARHQSNTKVSFSKRFSAGAVYNQLYSK